MPPKKKTSEDKLTVRQFRDGSQNWWCAMKHFTLDENKNIVLCAGGLWVEEEVEHLRRYLKTKKLL